MKKKRTVVDNLTHTQTQTNWYYSIPFHQDDDDDDDCEKRERESHLTVNLHFFSSSSSFVCVHTMYNFFSHLYLPTRRFFNFLLSLRLSLLIFCSKFEMRCACWSKTKRKKNGRSIMVFFSEKPTTNSNFQFDQNKKKKKKK